MNSDCPCWQTQALFTCCWQVSSVVGVVLCCDIGALHVVSGLSLSKVYIRHHQHTSGKVDQEQQQMNNELLEKLSNFIVLI